MRAFFSTNRYVCVGDAFVKDRGELFLTEFFFEFFDKVDRTGIDAVEQR